MFVTGLFWISKPLVTWDPGWFFGLVYFQVEQSDSLILGPCPGFYTGEHPTYPHLQRQSGLQTTSFQWYVAPFMGVYHSFPFFFRSQRSCPWKSLKIVCYCKKSWWNSARQTLGSAEGFPTDSHDGWKPTKMESFLFPARPKTRYKWGSQ